MLRIKDLERNPHGWKLDNKSFVCTTIPAKAKGIFYIKRRFLEQLWKLTTNKPLSSLFPAFLFHASSLPLYTNYISRY